MGKANLNSKYYKHISAGGLNEAIRIDGHYNGSVLANCVGFAWGRIYESSGSRPKMGLGDAKSLWAYNDGYVKSQTPSIGDIVIFSGGNYGHVAFVEFIYSNGDIKISESDYFKAGSGFAEKILTKSSGYHYLNGYKLLGFKQTEATNKIKAGKSMWKKHYKIIADVSKSKNKPNGRDWYYVEITEKRNVYHANGKLDSSKLNVGDRQLVYSKAGKRTANGNYMHFFTSANGKEYYYVSATKNK